MFAFALVKEGQAPPDSAAAILWIALLFAGTLALGRTFERERYGETIRALLLAPAPRPALYVGKLLGILCLLGLTEVLLVPLIALLFTAPLLDAAGAACCRCSSAARSGSRPSARSSRRC